MVSRPIDSPCSSGSDLQSSHCTLDEAFEDLDWETEKGLEAVACDTEGFLPPKVMVRTGHPSAAPAGLGRAFFFLQEPHCFCRGVTQPLQGLGWFLTGLHCGLPGGIIPPHCWGWGLTSQGFLPPLSAEVAGPFLTRSLCCSQLISSKVPKAEYIPTIIRRDDPSIIPILYVSARPAPPIPQCWVGVLPERDSDSGVACVCPRTMSTRPSRTSWVCALHPHHLLGVGGSWGSVQAVGSTGGQRSHPSFSRGDREEAEHLPQGCQDLEDAHILPGGAKRFPAGEGGGCHLVYVYRGSSEWTPHVCSL